MSTPRQRLYRRLPEIYRIRDGEQRPGGQLEAFMDVLDEVMAGMRDNVEALHHDHFVETCDDWVVPYLADLLGVSHLSGDPWTLRADVARTVFHRRRKGTLGAVESLSFSLTGWAAHAVELRERLAWNQHLNHQRPDEGGTPPLALRADIRGAVRGGTASLRDPALLSFAGGAFDPFARVADVKPGLRGEARHNLPNLGVFLWRLADYRVPLASPGLAEPAPVAGAGAGEAAARVRVQVHANAEPVRLFNKWRYRADDDPPELSATDAVPGPMPPARLNSGSPHGNPADYLRVDEWSGAPAAPGEESPGMVLHLPAASFGGLPWTFRGANLCAWEAGLRPALKPFEIVVDPELGRLLVGLDDLAAEAVPLAESLLLSWTYGFSGPTGAHPLPRDPTPTRWLEKEDEEGVAGSVLLRISRDGGSAALTNALRNLQDRPGPTIVEIADSATYTLDAGAIGVAGGMADDGGGLSFRLAHSLWLRAAPGQRPTVRLTEPLRFRPLDIGGAGDVASAASLTVRLEGVYFTREPAAAAFAAAHTALIERVALGSLELEGCTLDPGGSRLLDGSATGARAALRPSLHLADGYGFVPGSAEETDFDEVPLISARRCIAGALLADQGYRLRLVDSVVDAGAGVGDPDSALAVGSASGDPLSAHGAETEFDGATFFGRVRVLRIAGSGGLFLHALVAHDDQRGCVRLSRLQGGADRLPPNHGCVRGAVVSFADERFGEPGYAQLRLRSDRRVLEEGPRRDAMGAFGYLLNAHKWKNLDIRYREYMPVGVRPVLVPVT